MEHYQYYHVEVAFILSHFKGHLRAYFNIYVYFF
jgi:hypothetical protein